MQSVLIKVSLGSDENVMEKSANVFPELNHVENLHGEVGFIKAADVSSNVGTVPVSSQPGGHETRVLENEICRDGGGCVVYERVGPLDQSVTSLLTGFLCLVSLVAEVIFIALVVQSCMA